MWENALSVNCSGSSGKGGGNDDSETSIDLGPDFPLAMGASHTCALNPDLGKIYCWGNLQGGDGLGGESSGPTRIITPSPMGEEEQESPVDLSLGERAVDLSLGQNHGCMLTFNQNLYCWGKNDSWQLGNPLNHEQSYGNSPVPVNFSLYARIKNAIQAVIAVPSGSSTCVQTVKNEAYCWGKNTQLMGENNSDSFIPQPALIEGF